MYAPVVCRFDTYEVQLKGAAKDYAQRIRKLSAFQEWLAGARAENFVAENHEL